MQVEVPIQKQQRVTVTAKILKFPYARSIMPSPLDKINMLEIRLGELELSISITQRDLDICKKCLTDDLKEMSEVIKQLAKLRGINAQGKTI